MLELHSSFTKQKAVWIGHDWGSLVVWNIGLHHQDKVEALGSLCVPFGWGGHPDSYLDHIDRTLYPKEDYPYGQWDYMYFYYENFDLACEQMAEDPYKMIKLNFLNHQKNIKDVLMQVWRKINDCIDQAMADGLNIMVLMV